MLSSTTRESLVLAPAIVQTTGQGCRAVEAHIANHRTVLGTQCLVGPTAVHMSGGIDALCKGFRTQALSALA